MPFPNEHALRLQPPGRFDRDTFRRTSGGTLFGGKLRVPSSISIIWAKIKGKTEPGDPPILQALRFPKARWTPAAARQWIKNNMSGKGRFEAAGSPTSNQSEGIQMDENLEQDITGDLETYDQADEMAYEEVDPDLYDDPQTAANEQMEQLSETETEEQDMAESRQRNKDDEDDKPDKLYKVSDVEILAEGTWNGDTYTTKDLDQIVNNFNSLKNIVKPPAKLGHGKQGLLQSAGMPAAGWVASIKRVGKTLLADFVDVPRAIHRALTNKSYKRVSPEVYMNFQDPKGKRHGLVLAAVAFLGAEFPAIKTLKDIGKLYDATEELDLMALYDDNNQRNESRRVDYMPKEELTTEETTEEGTAEEETTEETSEEETQDTTEDIASDTNEEIPLDTTIEVTEEKPAPKPTPDPAMAAKMAEMEAKMADYESMAATRNGIVETLQKQLADQSAAASLAEDEKFLDEITESGKFPPAHRKKALALMTALRTDTETTLTYSEGEGAAAVDVDTSPLALFHDMLEKWPETIDMGETATGEDGIVRTATKKKYGDGSLPLKGEDTVAAVNKYMEAHPEAEYEEALMEVSRTQKK